MKLRVVPVDDHELVRQGLRSILERESDVEVVGEAASGRAALELARTLAPDLVVMDVAMRDQNGIEATRQIRAACPNVKVLALSSHADARYVTAMLDAARRGRSYLCAEVTGAVVGATLRGSPAAARGHLSSASSSPPAPSRRTAATSCASSTSTASPTSRSTRSARA